MLPRLVNPCDSLVLKDDKSSVKVADFNDPSMCVYAAILNWLRYVPSGHTCFCQLENACEHGAQCCFWIQHGRSHLGLPTTRRCSFVIGQNIGIKSLARACTGGIHAREIGALYVICSLGSI